MPCGPGSAALPPPGKARRADWQSRARRYAGRSHPHTSQTEPRGLALSPDWTATTPRQRLKDQKRTRRLLFPFPLFPLYVRAWGKRQGHVGSGGRVGRIGQFGEAFQRHAQNGVGMVVQGRVQDRVIGMPVGVLKQGVAQENGVDSNGAWIGRARVSVLPTAL